MFENETIVSSGLAYLQTWVGGWSRRKGWRQEQPRNPLELSALMMTELAELVEAYRHGNPPCDKPGLEGLSNAAEECADIAIRLADFCDEHNIDLGEAVVRKMACNEAREHRHGGKAY